MFLPISSTEIAESHFRKSTAQFVDHSPKHVRPNQHTKCYLCRHKHTKTPEGLRARSTRSSRLGRMRSYSACGADWKFMKPVTNENRISGSFRKTRVGSNIRHPGTIKQGSQRCVALLVVVTPETPMMDLVVNCRSAAIHLVFCSTRSRHSAAPSDLSLLHGLSPLRGCAHFGTFSTPTNRWVGSPVAMSYLMK
jgi:hypothetical protein